MLVHHIEYEFNTTDTGQQMWTQLWPGHADNFWLVHKPRLGPNSYFLFKVQKQHFTGADRSLGSFESEGRDFDWSVFVGKILYGGGDHEFLTPNLSC